MYVNESIETICNIPMYLSYFQNFLTSKNNNGTIANQLLSHLFLCFAGAGIEKETLLEYLPLVAER